MAVAKLFERAQVQAALVKTGMLKKDIAASTGVSTELVRQEARKIGPALAAVEELRREYAQNAIKELPIVRAVERHVKLIMQDKHLPTAHNALRTWQQNMGILSEAPAEREERPVFSFSGPVQVNVHKTPTRKLLADASSSTNTRAGKGASKSTSASTSPAPPGTPRK